MRNLLMECVGWLNWKIVAGGLAAVAMLALCAKLPSLSVVVGAAPLLLIVACLVPCLIPLVLAAARRRR